MAEVRPSLWYALHQRVPVRRIPIVAAASEQGNVCIMCTLCGHVFVDGPPFTGESEPVDHIQLASALYYHSCDDEGARKQQPNRSRK